MIKSISYNQNEIIEQIISLHCNGLLDADITYSTGSMYKGCKFSPKYKFDIAPQTKNAVRSDARRIPINNLSSIMFDPPFLATTGKSLQEDNNSNKIAKRFSVFPNEFYLHEFYIKVMGECYKTLKNDGVLIFKCQDKVSSGKQYFSHCFIYEKAVKIGFYPIDLFILLAKNRMTPKWQVDNQKHARKFHSYFWVLKKNKKKVKYTGLFV